MAKELSITNVVILKDDGLHVSYRKMCPHCGTISSTTYSFAGGVDNSNATCEKCGKYFHVRLSR